MKITFNIAPEGDWCIAVTDEGKTIYSGHDLPDNLLHAVLANANIEEESVYWTEEDWENEFE